jgi:hypothetical protein
MGVIVILQNIMNIVLLNIKRDVLIIMKELLNVKQIYTRIVADTTL